MLNLSNCHINLGSSELFKRLSLCLYGLCAYSVYCSGLSIIVKVASFLIIIKMVVGIIRKPIPMPQIKNLYYITDHWFLESDKFEQIRYDKHRVMIHFGIGFLLHLTGDKNKLIVIFSDQISPAIYRRLKVIEQVRL